MPWSYMHVYLVHIWGGWLRSPHPRNLKVIWRLRIAFSKWRWHEKIIPILLVADYQKKINSFHKDILYFVKSDASCRNEILTKLRDFAHEILSYCRPSSFPNGLNYLAGFPRTLRDTVKYSSRQPYPPRKSRSEFSWVRLAILRSGSIVLGYPGISQ